MFTAPFTTASTLETLINDSSITNYGTGFKLYHGDEALMSLVPCVDYTVKAPIMALLVDGGLQIFNLAIPVWLKIERNNEKDWAVIMAALEAKLLTTGVTVVAVARRGGRISHWAGGWAFGIGQTPLIQLLDQPNNGPSVKIANRTLWVDVLVDTRADYGYALAETIALYIFTKEDKPIDMSHPQVNGRLSFIRKPLQVEL